MTRAENEPIVAVVGDNQDCTAIARLLPSLQSKQKRAHLVLQQASAEGPPQAIYLNLSTEALLDLGMFISYLCLEATRGTEAQAKPARAPRKKPAKVKAGEVAKQEPSA